jgi:transcriptional regulator with PAS, ATPase and Fis domain
VPINCAAIPETLAESELFGHSRGAFTGAVQDRPGALVLADGGTLFLDEIEDLPLPIQAKLLRVVQDGHVRPLGAPRARRVRVRLIAASNRTLWEQVERGAFRRDLFYRLRVLSIELPPLRARRDDILDLAAHFISRFNDREGTCFRLPAPPRCRSLLEHAWPGNVRELENTLESLLITARASDHDLGDLLARRDLRGPTWLDERARILRTLEEHRWNRQRAAAALGISRVTLWRRMGRHGIRDPLAHAAGETT